MSQQLNHKLTAKCGRVVVPNLHPYGIVDPVCHDVTILNLKQQNSPINSKYGDGQYQEGNHSSISGASNIT